MKSRIYLFRFLLLVFLFPFVCSNAVASKICFNPNFDFGNASLQDTAVVSDPNKTITNSKPGTTQVPPVIILTVDPFLSSTALLKWTTSDPGLQGDYVVERYTLADGWVTIASLPFSTVLAYNDIITFPYCNPTDFSYRIHFLSSSGLDDAYSPIVKPSSPLSDLTTPENVSNLLVSVGPPMLLIWDRIINDSISRYDIQRTVDLNAWGPPIGSVTAAERIFWDANATPACESAFKYIVTTIDRCGNHSAPDYENNYVQTIKLDVPKPGPCDKSAKLVWNSYKNMPGGLSGYTVYRIDGISSSFKIIDLSDTSYVDTYNFQDGVTYLYSIGARDINGHYSTVSCQVGWTYKGVITPDTVYITQVGVENDSYINIKYYFSPIGSVDTLLLERSDDGGANYHVIDTLNPPVLQQSYFNDNTADFNKQSYYYRLVAIDNCGNSSKSINTSNSIWIQCVSTETENNLDWNIYESWLQGVAGYETYRILNNESVTIKLINSGPSTISYSDPLSGYDQSKMACYWVEAKENTGNPYYQNAVSKSNTCCVLKDAVLYMPNAFNPEGKNRVFRPVPEPLFVDANSFKMIIYSRWGQQLFETTDIVNGWDGTVNGQFTPVGQYNYIITYKSLEGKDYTKRGTVLLVR